MRRMERRDALRAVTALTLGAVAGCDADSPTSATSPTKAPAPQSPALSADPLPGPSSSAPTQASEIQSGPRDRPAVALTFHGQGDTGIVTRLLDELRRGGAHVTVLAVGTWLTAEPALCRRIVADGHELGNHTQHHADIKAMDPAQAYAEINACAQALHSVTGSIGRWFRPSQTQFATPTIKAAARRAGYPTCLSYDVDPHDYTDPGASAVVSATLAAVRPGSIVSLHFGHEGTVTAIPAILAGLRTRGLRPVTVSQLLT